MARSAQRHVQTVPMTDAVRAALSSAGYKMAEDPQLAAVFQALSDGKFILAVKHYRTATGVGLRTAKEAVEAIQANCESSS